MPASVLKLKNAIQSSVSSFLHKIFIVQKLNNVFGYILLIFFAVVLGYLFAVHTVLGIGIAGLMCCLAVAVVCILNAETGLYINVVYCFFAFGFSRYFFNDEFPTGVASDILVVTVFFSFFISKKVNLKASLNQFARSPVVIVMLILYFYLLIELFNPYAHSFVGWYQTFRKSLGSVLLLFIAYNVFDNYKSIRRFLTVLFIICTISGLYGCIQEWHGLFDYERAWAMADDNRFGLIFIDGDFRKFSTMSDPTAYGIMMASCGILFTILAWNEKRWGIRVIVMLGVACMFLGMAYSGTRTAYAMAAAGMFIFILLTLNKRSTQLLAVICVLGFIGLMRGPFYGNSTINRIRSTFSGSNDASYKVREVNRAFIQPYIYSHPIGGGLCTTGANGLRFNPSHYLAGFPPDSGYLKKALETGWIGLIIICILYFVTLKNCIHGYFGATNHNIKIIYAACCAFLFSFYVADFAQDALGQITDVVVYYPLIAITIRISSIEKKQKENAEKNNYKQEIQAVNI